MERMTTKRKDGRWAIKNDDGATPLEQMKKIPLAINRLAAYEDAGLEPEEVLQMKGSWEVVCKTYRINCIPKDGGL